MKYLAFALAGTALAAAPLLAQAVPATPDSSLSQVPATSSASPGQQAPATAPAGKPDVAAGAQVSDAQGGAVGTIESVSGGNAVVSTGTAKAALPLSAFAQGPNGLIIGMTKAELEAAIAKASGGASTASASAATSAPASIAVGAPVSDTKGGKVGTVAAVSGNLVTVATANTKVQLPKSAFGQGASGLVIAMTATELEAAAKAAGVPGKGGG